MRKIRERSLRLESLEDRMLLAVTAGGEEVAAAAFYAAPQATEATQLATPTNLTATCPANRKLNVSWDAVNNASGYTLYYKVSTNSSWTALSVTTNSAALSNLTQTQCYDIKVVAVGDGTNYTNSEESAVISAMPNTSYSTVVTTLRDINAASNPTGDISFRQAVYFASRTGDTITFAEGLSGTIDLATYGQITILSSAKGFTVEGDNRIALTNSATGGANRIFFCGSSDAGYDVTLNDLTITGCSVTNDVNYYNRGGAIFVWNTAFGAEGDPYVAFTLNNCTITDNSAAEEGGFFYAYGGCITANNCTFTGNSAPTGGAIGILAGDVFLADCTLTENTAVGTGDGSAYGGALYLNTIYASRISSCTISNNKAMVETSGSAHGGAFYLVNVRDYENNPARSGLWISDCEITGNTATRVSTSNWCQTTQGGAFYLQQSGMRVYNCSITGNSAADGLWNYGGAVYSDGNTANQAFFYMTDISDNFVGLKDDIWARTGGAYMCQSSGGALFFNTVFHMVNCTVLDNAIYVSRKDFGGSGGTTLASMAGTAFYANNAAAIYDTTISGNRVLYSNSGTGGYFADAFDTAAPAGLMIYGSVTMINSVVLGNYCEDTDTSARTDLDVYSRTYNYSSADMVFDSCAYNSSALRKSPETHGFDIRANSIDVTDYEAFFNDYANGDYTLAPDSPAIDATDMSVIWNFGYEYDIRYYLYGEECYRVVNGNPDIGAYEFQATPSFEVTIEDYVGDYDGQAHSITVSGLQDGDDVTYSENGTDWSSSNFAYTDPGTYTVYVKVQREGYQDFSGSGTVTINEVTQKLQVAVVVSASAASATEVDELADSITSATVGDTLYAQVWIKNTDGSDLGCTGGYIDLSYTTAALDAGSYTVSPIYAQMATYVDSSADGLVATFGGCSQTGVNDLAVDQWALLGTFTFTASAAGNAEIASALPTMNGVHITGLNLARAGEGNFADSEIAFSSASFTVTSGGGQPLAAPRITTGSKAVYVSYGANRHLLQWSAVDNASGYELSYSANGSTWTTIETAETSAVVKGLTYGTDVIYRVRALGSGSYTDSDWSTSKTFNVCPMDINNDGDISGGDRTLLANSWLAEEGDDEYRYYADINGDGDVGGADRAYLSNNWLGEVGDDDLQYPPAKRADAFFAEFASADLDVDLSVF